MKNLERENAIKLISSDFNESLEAVTKKFDNALDENAITGTEYFFVEKDNSYSVKVYPHMNEDETEMVFDVIVK